MQETAISLVPKEEVAYFREKEDKKFIEFITNELTREISERLIQVLETNDEIVIKKPVLRISEYGPLNSVEYKKIVDWEPLVRCKDCKHRPYEDEDGDIYVPDWGDYTCPFLCEDSYYNGMPEDDFFCKRGERKE